MGTDVDIDRAVAVLRGGGVVAFATETVYGLGADAQRSDAVARVFAIKGRPVRHPVIVHLAHAAQLTDWAREVTPAAWCLAEAFWPGPMTLILPRHAHVATAVTGGLDTVGLRVPAHPLAHALLAAFGGGVAAPSANRFGSVSPTTAAHVRQDLGSDVDLILDGGPCEVGLESTIVDLSTGAARLLRPGGVTLEQLEAVLRVPVPLGPADSRMRAPGLLASHYAPRARVELADAIDLHARATAALAAGERVGVLTIGAPPVLPVGTSALQLPDDAADAARALYAALREADVLGLTVLLAALPDDAGIGRALVDRLRRAAGPRPG